MFQRRQGERERGWKEGYKKEEEEDHGACDRQCGTVAVVVVVIAVSHHIDLTD